VEIQSVRDAPNQERRKEAENEALREMEEVRNGGLGRISIRPLETDDRMASDAGCGRPARTRAKAYRVEYPSGPGVVSGDRGDGVTCQTGGGPIDE
jgi:hypothetical protein